MARNRRLTQCLNCKRVLKKTDNYCPTCGQENSDHKVSIKIFIQDFFSNYLSVDTSLGRTFVPFLFKPGKLTNTFNRGERKKFIHPIRLYLILSLFYFFVVGYIIPYDMIDRIMFSDIFKATDKINELTIDQRQKIDSLTLSNENLQGLPIDSISNKFNELEDFPIKSRWKILKLAAIDAEISQDSFNIVADSVDISFTGQLKTETGRKFIANSNIFAMNVAKNLPIMMFLLIPVFALLLLMLFHSSRKFYVEHLIHGLHLHSFSYFLYGIGILILNLVTDYSFLIGFILFILVTVYAFLSIKRVYNNSVFKSVLKFFLLGFFYLCVITIAVCFELYISIITL